MTNTPRPGWYPDPAGMSGTFRWWDGETWTDLLSETPNAPAPPVLDRAAEPAGRRRSPLRTVVALILVIALFLGAGAGVGMWLWEVGSGRSSGPTTPGGPAGPPSGISDPTAAAPAEPPGQLDESSRTATIGDASIRLPDDPYELRPDPRRVPGVLDAAFLAEAEVHDRYDGEHDWSAMVALAALHVPADDPDPERAGRQTLGKLAKLLYGNVTRVSDAEVTDRSVDGNAGVEITAQVHYAVDRLPSRYDEIRAVVVALDDGTVIAAISSVPDDADPELAILAQRSVDSLTIR